MCGIQLFLTKLKDVEIRQLFLKLFEKIKVRGPEYSELIEKSIGNYNLKLGFQRLKINDVSDKGNQPFILDNEKMFLSVIINGEIYNHTQLEKDNKISINSTSDCEIVFHLVNKYLQNNLPISQLFNKLDGVFAGCIYYLDKKSNISQIITFRDIYGVRPMYYAEDENSFGISSELKGL